MTTTTHEVRRAADGELLGYLRDRDGSGETWVPLTVFGYPLGPAAEYVEAMTLVEDSGLGFLGGPWRFREERDGKWYACAITEASPSRITVQVADGEYPYPELRRTLAAPGPEVLSKGAS